MLLNKISGNHLTYLPDIIELNIQLVFQYLSQNQIIGPYNLTVHSVNNSIVLIFTIDNLCVYNYKTVYNLVNYYNIINITLLIINNVTVFGNQEIVENIYGFKIIRHYNTFRQTNSLVKGSIYQQIDNLITNNNNNNNNNNIVLVGGEPYIYAKILFNKYSSCHIFSDFDDIIHYSNKNLFIEKAIKNIIIKKISYNIKFIKIITNNIDFIIINVKSLLPSHINTIKYYLPKNFIVISCNRNNIKKINSIKNYNIQILPVYNIDIIIGRII
jgi:hypothetical protein